MSCHPESLKNVPLFALLDDDEAAILAGQVELRNFAPRQRIYKIGDTDGHAYVMVSGRVRVTTVDEDHQEVIVDEPSHGEFFGFASMLEQTPHQTNAVAIEETACLEVDRNDIMVLLQKKPHAGMDMLTVLGRQFHSAQQLVRVRANRNPNELIEQEATFGERIADSRRRIRRFLDLHHHFSECPGRLFLPEPIEGREILGSLSLHSSQSLSINARRNSSARHHDEPESPGHEGSPSQ